MQTDRWSSLLGSEKAMLQDILPSFYLEVLASRLERYAPWSNINTYDVSRQLKTREDENICPHDLRCNESSRYYETINSQFRQTLSRCNKASSRDIYMLCLVDKYYRSRLGWQPFVRQITVLGVQTLAMLLSLAVHIVSYQESRKKPALESVCSALLLYLRY